MVKHIMSTFVYYYLQWWSLTLGALARQKKWGLGPHSYSKILIFRNLFLLQLYESMKTIVLLTAFTTYCFTRLSVWPTHQPRL